MAFCLTKEQTSIEYSGLETFESVNEAFDSDENKQKNEKLKSEAESDYERQELQKDSKKKQQLCSSDKYTTMEEIHQHSNAKIVEIKQFLQKFEKKDHEEEQLEEKEKVNNLQT